jgi:hypothetical protein
LEPGLQNVTVGNSSCSTGNAVVVIVVKTFGSKNGVPHQSDQIGRISGYWGIVYFLYFSKIIEVV